MEFNIELKSDEIILVGTWKIDNGKIVADEVCQRIEKLVTNHLRKVDIDKTG